ncbi:DUF1194 domain-containing protein [Chachezhania antarctica]|uniref:DUF1194 domain-containing protein n=1 Tax=Chachezhania antarctica TaxID=2340860 RepID=UPI000EAFAAB5|nr:DUF1194 domain-containing protein [Chachezhania antarctica]
MIRSRALILSFCLATPPVAACELALALAVDVSGSVDPGEYRLQMDGLVEGLRDYVVSEALVRAEAEVSLVQWSGSSRQRVSVPWTRIDSYEALDDLTAEIATAPRVWRNFSTAIGEALDFTMQSFDSVDHCRRMVIDVSGDGVSNEGIAPTGIHPDLRRRGITVNAIAIEEGDAELTAYFFENVIMGEGAFVVTALTFEDYPARIRRKLLREVARATAAAE